MNTEITLDGKILPVRIGDFVTAKVANIHETRQGCVSGTWQDKYLTIACESGARCVVEPDVAIVPPNNIWGPTRGFVHKFRRELGIPPRQDLPK